MGIFRKISRFFRRSRSESGFFTLREGDDWRDFIDLPVSAALAVGTVYRCVQLLSESVAQLPMVYQRRRHGTFVADPDNVLSYLLNVQPDPNMSAFDFKRQLVIELLMTGNAYIIPTYDFSIGSYIRLALCGRNTVSHDPVTDTYSVNDLENGIYGVYREEEVIHIKGMPGHSAKQGVSVLSHARQTLGIAVAGDRETLKRFNNGGDVRGIVTNGKDTIGFGEYQDEELERKASELDRRFRELGDRIVALGGTVGWIPISMTSADMQFLESRKFTVREICRFFGVHPSFVFDDTSNNYKSAEMANVAFLSNTLNPLLAKIENEFLRKLFPASLASKRKITFDRREIYACDLQSRVNYLSKLLGLGWSVNEVRSLEGLPPVPDGDTPLVSANLKTLGQLLSDGAEEGNENTDKTDEDNQRRQ